MTKTKRRNRAGAQLVRVHNTVKGATLPLIGKERGMKAKANKTRRASSRKRSSSKRRKRGGRRRNTSTALQTASVRKVNTTRKSNRASRSRKRNTGRFKNPAQGSITSLIVLGGGVVAAEYLAGRFIPSSSPAMSASVKVGLGFALRSSMARKLPLGIGKHADSIGGGLILLGVVDLLRQFALPKVIQFLPASLQPATGVSGFTNVGEAGGLGAWQGYPGPIQDYSQMGYSTF